jgi:aspartyl protease family protein
VVVAGGAFTRRRRLGEMLANLVLWAGVFMVAIVGYTYRAELFQIGDRVVSELRPGAAVVDIDRGSAIFKRSLNGSFRVNASVNGAQIRLILDTGASAVVLAQADAIQAGIDISKLRFTVPVQTANGTGRAALVILDSISVGDISRKNIRAYVSEEHALETSLLGMTYLDTLSGFSIKDDALILND